MPRTTEDNGGELQIFRERYRAGANGPGLWRVNRTLNERIMKRKELNIRRVWVTRGIILDTHAAKRVERPEWR